MRNLAKKVLISIVHNKMHVFLSCLILVPLVAALRVSSIAPVYSRKSVMTPRSNFIIKSCTLNQRSRTALANTETDKNAEIASSDDKFDLSAWLNPNTRGGVIVWSIVLILVPVGFYNYFVSTGMEETKVGATVGAVFVLLSNVAWASTYIFRVANKDMTYAKQLRDYENAVLQKRLDELADDEIDALMSEIDAENADAPKKQ